MRILPAELTAALESGNYNFYTRLTINSPSYTAYVRQPLSYRLSPTHLEVTFEHNDKDIFDDDDTTDVKFILTRGVLIQGVPYTISTSDFFAKTGSWDGTIQTVEASLLPRLYFSTPGDLSYQAVIQAVCSFFGKTAVFKDPAAAWLNYQFLPTSKWLVLREANTLFRILRQKYLISACDNGNNEILFGATSLPVAAPDYQATAFKASLSTARVHRQFTWRDETGVAHVAGETDAPLWNLGFLPLTADPPWFWYSTPPWSFKVLPHLKYQALDTINTTFQEWINVDFLADVTEIFNPAKSPSWYFELNSFNWAEGATEGGAIPTTIEDATAYTQLNTSSFDNILSDLENNLQAAMDVIDDHDHGISSLPLFANDFLVGGNHPVTGRFEWLPTPTFNVVPILRTDPLVGLDNVYEPKGLNTTNFNGILDATITSTQKLAERVDDHGHTGTYEPANANIQAHIAAAAPHSNHLSKVSANRPGVTKLYRNDNDSPYNIQTLFDGARWLIQGYYNDTYHAPARVSRADSAGVADTLTTNWSTYVTQIRTWSGATSVPNPTMYYIVIGKLVFWFVDIVVSPQPVLQWQDMLMNLPHTAAKGGHGMGRERTTTGYIVQANIAQGWNFAVMVDHQNGSLFDPRFAFMVSGVYGLA